MNKYLKNLLTFSSFFALPLAMNAQNKIPPASSAGEPLAIIMLSIAALLIVVIFILAKTVFVSYDIFKKRNKSKTSIISSFILLAFLAVSCPATAQDSTIAESGGSGLIGGLSQTSFYFLLGVIILELVIIAFLVRTFYLFAGLRKAVFKTDMAVGEEAPVKKKKFGWFEKLNKTRSLDAASEAAINLGHDYDGIGELDNPTPPWWQWGFVLSVIFAFVYMYVYHVSESAPLQIEELAIANAKAEKQIEKYLASAAANIDENTVTLMTDPADLAAGQSIFVAQCAACHGVDAGGTVGPNLTDEYWLHGGSIQDIFRTIKYGVPEKGMKSWKDDYSAKQIAQICAYIHSLQGTKPAAPKAPEGELYRPETENTGATEVPDIKANSDN